MNDWIGWIGAHWLLLVMLAALIAAAALQAVLSTGARRRRRDDLNRAAYIRRGSDHRACRDAARWFRTMQSDVRELEEQVLPEEEETLHLLINNFFAVEIVYEELSRRLRSNHGSLGYIRCKGGTMSRIRLLALEMLNHYNSVLGSEQIIESLQRSQEKEALLMNEIWLTHDVLSLEIIGGLSRLLQALKGRMGKHRAIDRINRVMMDGGDLDEWKAAIRGCVFERSGKLDAEAVEYICISLRDLNGRAAAPQQWLSQYMVAQGYELEQVITGAHRRRAEERVFAQNAFSSLINLKGMQWKDVFEQTSLVEQCLMKDPAGVYPDMDDASRGQYREQIARFAERLNKSELFVARKCLDFARQHEGQDWGHLGFCLFDSKAGNAWFAAMGASGAFPTGRCGWAFYGLGLLALTFFFSAVVWALLEGTPAWARWLTAIIAVLPAFGAASYLINRVTAKVLMPRRVLRMRLTGPLPDDARTLVVITALAADEASLDACWQHLEDCLLRNREAGAHYGLLLDLRAAPQPQMPEDEPLIRLAWDRAEALNREYGPDTFFCLLRRRTAQDSRGRYTGWERKRGALMALCALLRDGESGAFLGLSGCPEALIDTRYVLTLDADTQIQWGSVQELVGAMIHPLNRPVVENGRVVRGYGLMQPRVGASTRSLNQTAFAAINGGEGGLEPYAFATPDPWQDLFETGIYTGKAIFDLPLFYQMLKDRIPDNTVLSHDLLEGGHVRVAAISDHVFVDEFPATSLEYFSRLHRWVRGDWQLLPWILPGRRSPALSAVARLQMANNLLSSLIPVFAMLSLLAAALLGRPWLGLIVALLPGILSLLDGFMTGTLGEGGWKVAGFYGMYLKKFVLDALLLPWRGAMCADAVVRTLARVYLTRRNLLEWTTAGQAAAWGERSVGRYFRAGLPGVLAGFLLAAACLAGRSWVAAPVLALLWLPMPLAAWWVDRPRVRRQTRLDADQERELRCWMAQTWRYFQELVGPEGHYLPPDNVQYYPAYTVAWRTSPTNIGLAVMAEAIAATMGFESLEQAADRVEQTIAAVEGLEKWRGHLYNWYDIKDLKALRPRYVSSVDNGNLACYLLLAGVLLGRLLAEPCTAWELWQGLIDGLAVLGEKDAAWQSQAEQALHHALAQGTDEAEQQVRSWLDEIRQDGGPMAGALISQAEGLLAANRALCMAGVAADQRAPAALAAREETDGPLRDLILRCRALSQRVRALGDRLEGLALGMDFGLLYNRQKKLFHIGYDVERQQFSPSYYDLLASESRQTSLFAIATGQVPAEHWFALGRPVVMDGEGIALRSWGGSMFEYLMPALLFPVEPGTLMGETLKNVIRRQREYARHFHVPWGISESAYFEMDTAMNYQYKSFGVPGLSMKAGVNQDIVIAPYASLMALKLAPDLVWDNARALQQQQAKGRYAYYEAVDYTSGKPEVGKGKVVQSHMVHHEGMSLLSMVNYLRDDLLVKTTMSLPPMRALHILMDERAPRSGRADPVISHNNRGVRWAGSQDYREELRGAGRACGRSMTLVSNGAYQVRLAADGTGRSLYRAMDLNRWRPGRQEPCGLFMLLRDEGGAVRSTTLEPRFNWPDEYRVVYQSGRADFIRQDGGVETRTTVFVDGTHNVEVRRLVISNESGRDRRFELFIYGEMALNDHEADIGHPAYHNLFVECGWDGRALTLQRREGAPGSRPLCLAAALQGAGEAVCVQTQRVRALGRGNPLTRADFLREPWPAQPVSLPLDPVLCMRTAVCVPAGETAQISLVLSAADTRAQALSQLAWAQAIPNWNEIIELSCCQARAMERYLGVTTAQMRFIHRFLAVLERPLPLTDLQRAAVLQNRQGPSGLWPMGISGSEPIVGLEITGQEPVHLGHLLAVHGYLRRMGMGFDLVVFNADTGHYRQQLREQLQSRITSSTEADMLGVRGGVYLVDEEHLRPQDTLLLRAASRVWFKDSRQLTGQLPGMGTPLPEPQPLRPATRRFPALALPPVKLAHNNGYGGFGREGREYVIHNVCRTPMPWCHILTNGQCGVLLANHGPVLSWLHNSRENKITPWEYDAVLVPPSMGVLARDEEDGQVWEITGKSWHRGDGARIRYGFGTASYESAAYGLLAEQRFLVPPEDRVVLSVVSLHNPGPAPRRLSLTVWADFVLGVHREQTQAHILVEPDSQGDGLIAHNFYRDEFHDTAAFLAVPGVPCQFTGHRDAFISDWCDITRSPAMTARDLDSRQGAGGGGFGALRFFVDLAPGSKKEWLILLGATEQPQALEQWRRQYATPRGIWQAEERTERFWDGILGRIQVKTPEPRMDVMTNGWLLYQTYASRFMARAGYYQIGGAFGFRDQLQDCLALLWTKPAWVRDHILISAAHQFRSGDVQHWWHPPQRGVRTRISDDLLFLPYVASEYIRVTGDIAILEQWVPYLEDVEIPPGQDDYYGPAATSEYGGTLWDHCLRAVRRAGRMGEHGLPLMGTGDWNDAMSSIGDQGRGESVWLGWFLLDVLGRMTALARRTGAQEVVAEMDALADGLVKALNTQGWDGLWYRRAFDDDGQPVGSQQNIACQIDCISQCWAAISGGAPADRAVQALQAMGELLWSPRGQLLKLLTPPFTDEYRSDPGYIKGYVPGVRENGGQYTHAAAWAVWGYITQGMGEPAVELMKRLMPTWHTDDAEAVEVYKVEPYVVAADVYAAEPHVGRGGWTWYTGSAAWMYNILLEKMLGFTVEGSQLTLAPCVAAAWAAFDITYRYRGTRYHIHVKNPDGVQRGVRQMLLDGREVPGFLTLLDDELEHHVTVVMGEPAANGG